MMSASTLDLLTSARRVADYAGRNGIEASAAPQRVSAGHMGALLADVVLQAGVNYHTVVRARVDRILASFPQAARLSAVRSIVLQGQTPEFLLWKHPTKINRFMLLTDFLWSENVQEVDDLRRWLKRPYARERLLQLNGIGPKSIDYMSCLIGIDCIAVDRHIRTFASKAGVAVTDYDSLRIVMSYAADLLGVSRREFDAWVWSSIAQKDNRQYQLL